jgi:DNA-binding transcriptional LysR family regulator
MLAASLDPRRLLTFREVARHESFSRAAEALALTQPAVSQQVAALERQLGTRLLERGPGGIALTDSGRLLLAHAEALAERLALAGAQLGELTDARERRVRVGAFPSALANIVPAALARVIEDAPELEASVNEGTTEELAAAVRAGELHLAVCFQDAAAPRREHPATRRHDLVEEPMIAMLPPDHRLAGRRSLRLEELADETWTIPSASGLVIRACREAGFEPRLAYESRDPLAIRALVAAGLAVTLTPRLLAGDLHGVALVPLAGTPARRVLYALTPDAGTTPLTERLLDALAAVARATA